MVFSNQESADTPRCASDYRLSLCPQSSDRVFETPPCGFVAGQSEAQQAVRVEAANENGVPRETFGQRGDG
jgi:hypothetical protein